MSNAPLRIVERTPTPRAARWSPARAGVWLVLMMAMGGWMLMILHA